MCQNNFIWIYIMPMMFLTPIMSISMNSWFSMWLILELNLMTFIPMIMFMNKFYKEISMKYFIVQSFSSSMLIFSMNLFFIDNLNINNNLFFMLMNYLMNISLLIKIGSTPFHSWFINLMNNLNWMTCFILSTWQKIIPMTMLMYLLNYKILILSAFMNCLVSGILGLNHQSIRLIMSFSSINHLSWMLMNLLINELLWLLYFFSYMIINLSIMFILYKFNLFYINQLYLINMNKINFFLMFNFLSISGLPPMFGFMMKWYSIYMISKSNFMIILTIILMMSILTFIFYTRLMMTMILIYNYKIKFMLMMKILPSIKFNLKKILIISSFMNLWMMNMWLH